jgi:hypothetical protein
MGQTLGLDVGQGLVASMIDRCPPPYVLLMFYVVHLPLFASNVTMEPDQILNLVLK